MAPPRRSSRKISWALIGLGAQGVRLAQALAASRTGTLAAVIAGDAARAEEFAKRFGVPHSYDSLKRALASGTPIDAVCVATRNDEHASDILAALRAGKNVLAEKPLTLTVAEGRTIMRAAARARRQCAVDFQLRQDPAIIEARAMIAKGALGPLSYIDMLWAIGSFGEAALPPLPRHMQWREQVAQAGGGALVARGVHLFDLINFLTGEAVSEVLAHSDASARSVDKTAAGILMTSKGTPAMIATSKMIPGAANHIAIYGRDGALMIDPFGGKESTLVFTSKDKQFTKTFAVPNLYASVFDAFAVPAARNMNATAYDGVQATAILEAFKTSAKEKRAIRVARLQRQ